MKWILRIIYPFVCIKTDEKDYKKKTSKKYTEQIPARKSYTRLV